MEFGSSSCCDPFVVSLNRGYSPESDGRLRAAKWLTGRHERRYPPKSVKQAEHAAGLGDARPLSFPGPLLCALSSLAGNPFPFRDKRPGSMSSGSHRKDRFRARDGGAALNSRFACPLVLKSA